MLGQTLNKRIESFDIVKGLAMFSVVNWHVMNNIGIPGTPIGEHGSFIYQFLGLIQLPLFMFVSGFFAYKEKDGQRYRSVDLLSKAKHLLLPLVFAGLIWVMFLEYNTGRTFGGLLREYVLADNPFYFLLCLFELYVAYSLMMWLLRRFPGIVGSVAILIGGYVVCVLCYKLLPEPVMTALCLEQITLMFYVPFAFGVLCARFKNQWNLFIKDNKTVTWLLIVDIVFFYILNISEIHIPNGFGFIIIQLQVVCFIQTIVALVIRWNEMVDCGKVSKVSKCAFRYFLLIGQNSLAIYILHYFFRFNCAGLLGYIGVLNYSTIAIFAVTVPLSVVIVACALLMKNCLAASPLLDSLVLGKKR